MPGRKPKYDWDRIITDWNNGQSTGQLAIAHNTSKVYIRTILKRARRKPGLFPMYKNRGYE